MIALEFCYGLSYLINGTAKQKVGAIYCYERLGIEDPSSDISTLR